MSDNYRQCRTCGDLGFFGSRFMPEHSCKPVWECRGAWEDYPNAEWIRIHAVDAEDAAERFAEKYDCEGGEYVIIGGRIRGDVIVYVRKPMDDESLDVADVEMFEIEAEPVPTYHGHRLDRKKAA